MSYRRQRKEESLFGSYTFPYDIQLSGTFFSRQGTTRQGIIAAPTPVAAAVGA